MISASGQCNGVSRTEALTRSIGHEYRPRYLQLLRLGFPLSLMTILASRFRMLQEQFPMHAADVLSRIGSWATKMHIA